MTQRSRTNQIRRILNDLEREGIKWKKFRELKVLVEQRLSDGRFRVSTRCLGQLLGERKREREREREQEGEIDEEDDGR